MRKFKVWLNKNIVGEAACEETIALPDDTPDDECEQACMDCLETIISNELDTGWEEI